MTRDSGAASRGRGVLLGAGAGTIGLACCVGPAIAALIGVTSATTAVALATDLYSGWGWAFKLAGAAFAAAAIALVARRSRSCATKPRLMRFGVIVVVVGFATYGALYAGTTWLGARVAPSPPQPLVLAGATAGERVVSGLDQVHDRYPHVTVDPEAVSSSAVRFRVGWVIPDVDPSSDEYAEQIAQRVGDMREATMLLLRSIAADMPQVRRFTAFEDLLFVPTWSRSQILATREPHVYRDFDAYMGFVMDAEALSGYSQLQIGN